MTTMSVAYSRPTAMELADDLCRVARLVDQIRLCFAGRATVGVRISTHPETGQSCVMVEVEPADEVDDARKRIVHVIDWYSKHILDTGHGERLTLVYRGTKIALPSPLPVRATLTLHSDPPPFWVDAEGQVRVAGSGVSLERLVEVLMETGHHPVHVGRKLSLDFALVYAAIAYYLRHQTEMDAWMKARQEERQRVADEQKGNLPPIGGKLDAPRSVQNTVALGVPVLLMPDGTPFVRRDAPAPTPVPRLAAPYAGWMREDGDGTIYVGKSQGTLDDIVRDWNDSGIGLGEMFRRYPPLTHKDFCAVVSYRQEHHAAVDAYLAARREAADLARSKSPSSSPALPNGFMFLGSHVKSNLPPIGGKFDPSLACGVVMVAMQWEDDQ